MNSIFDVSVLPKGASGPFTVPQLREYLVNNFAASSPASYPTVALFQALEMCAALEELAAMDVFVSITPRSVTLTWPVFDVIIEVALYETGAQNISGRSQSGGTPKANISTIASAITGVVNLTRFRSMARDLS